MALANLNYFSQTLGMGMTLEVILPEQSQGIGAQGIAWDGEEKLPVLYLLHGTSDDQTIWQRRTSIERYVAGRKLAVVMPTTHLGAYTNQRHGFAYFDYIAREVPKICQNYFPISREREKNFVGGLSMGGYGALKIGLRCGDRFSHAIGLSSGCDRLRMLPPEAANLAGIEELDSHKGKMDSTAYSMATHFFLNFGSAKEYNASKDDNLFNLARDAVETGKQLPHIFMSCGAEDLAVGPNRKFHKLLEELGVEHHYDEAPGIHDWLYWDTHIQRALDWLPV